MLRKLAVLSSNSPRPMSCDADIPDSPLAIDASRSLLRVVNLLTTDNSYPESIFLLFGMYRAYIAYACLLNSIFRAADARSHSDDIDLLENLAATMLKVSKVEKDFVPLSKALQSLCMETKRKVNKASAMEGLMTQAGIEAGARTGDHHDFLI